MSFKPRDYARHILDEIDSLPHSNPLRLTQSSRPDTAK
jgi:hypothetical protein